MDVLLDLIVEYDPKVLIVSYFLLEFVVQARGLHKFLYLFALLDDLRVCFVDVHLGVDVELAWVFQHLRACRCC